jgi:hypothetical protein
MGFEPCLLLCFQRTDPRGFKPNPAGKLVRTARGYHAFGPSAFPDWGFKP